MEEGWALLMDAAEWVKWAGDDIYNLAIPVPDCYPILAKGEATEDGLPICHYVTVADAQRLLNAIQ